MCMNTLIYIAMIVVAVVIVSVIATKARAAQGKSNEILDTRDAAYIRMHESVTAFEVNNEQVGVQSEMLKGMNAPEYIVPAGKVDMVLSYESRGGVPGVVRVNNYTDKLPASFEVEKGKLYEVYFDKKENVFAIKQVEKMTWKTPLYKKFLEKYPR